MFFITLASQPEPAMYTSLIFGHGLLRWLVVASLLYALYRAYKGYFSGAAFSKVDNAVRHWSATIAHIQLMIGMVLYFQSPLIKYFLSDFSDAVKRFDTVFFGLIHGSLMLIAVVVLTIGSAKAKRKQTDREKFKTMMIWFTIAFIIILIAVPWPFSPLAKRPYFR